MAAPYSHVNRDSTTDWITNRFGATALFVAAFLGFSVLTAAQFASGVNVVEVYATVTDQSGEPLRGLMRDDFVIREDNQQQTISTFAAGDFPLSVAIAVDRSFSMAQGGRLSVAKSAAKVFLRELRGEDEAMVLAIGSTVETVAPRSTRREEQSAAIDRLEPWGSTGLHDAIIAGIDGVQDAKGRRALVLLSDGDDRFSTATAGDALSRARRSDVMVYPIAMGRERPPLFVELAALTGGRSFHVREPKQLPDTLRRIARELRYQYLLGYTPARPIVAGEERWRSINVTVNRPNVRVRARDGYLAK
jgi:Ca-activated chloride channel family protein